MVTEAGSYSPKSERIAITPLAILISTEQFNSMLVLGSSGENVHRLFPVHLLALRMLVLRQLVKGRKYLLTPNSKIHTPLFEGVLCELRVSRISMGGRTD